MPQTNETPAGSQLAGVSCNQLGGCLQHPLTLCVYRAQHLIAAHGIRPDRAAMVASIAFEGNGHGYPHPDAPGAKGPDGTSQKAAAAIQPDVTRLRRLALRTLGQLGAATVLEAVPVAEVTRESLQPRFSELRAMGLVEATGERRRNPSGKSAAVLRLTDEGSAAL